MSERDRNQALGEGGEEEFAEGGPTQPVRPASTTSSSAEHEPNSHWQGTIGATDFLGLDGDLRLDPIASGSQVDSFPGLSNSAEGPVLDSWLMEIEGHGPQSPDAATATDEDPALEPYDSSDEDGDPRSPTTEAEPGRPRLFAQLAAGLVVVALAGGGAWYWQQQRQHTATPPIEVATRPTPKPKVSTPAHTTPSNTDHVSGPLTTPPVSTVANPDTAPDTTLPPTITMPDPSGSVSPSGTDPVAAQPDITPKSTPSGTHTGSETAPIDFTPGQLTITFPPTTPPKPAHVEPPTPAPFVEPRTAVAPKGGTMPGTVRRATEADFVDLWRESRIPTELFGSERRLHTINVGRVRALVIGGEYFEGNLYAVGQGRIWLDLEMGRISFEASTVRELTQLAPLPAGTNLKAKKIDETAALPHVEVRLPGGSVTGRLVGQDGRRITMITDDGLRTVVESDDIRPVTARNTRVLGKASDLDAKPH